MQLSNWLILPTLVILASGCPTRPDPTPKNLGFQCLAVPSEWNEAASIIEVDEERISRRIGLVDTVTVSKDSLVGFPAYTANVDYKIGFLISTLEQLTATTGWSAKVNADLSSSTDTKSTYGDLLLDITQGQPERDAEAWFKRKGYSIKSGKKYYFVSEAIKAKEISYEIKSGDMAKLGGEAKVKELAEGKLDVFQRGSESTYKLSGKYARHLNVCIKPRQILSTKGSDGQEYLKFVDVTEPIKVSGTR